MNILQTACGRGRRVWGGMRGWVGVEVVGGGLEGAAAAQDDIESCREQKNSVIFHLYANSACYTN